MRMGQEAEEKLHRFFHSCRLQGEWFELTTRQKDLVVSIQAYADGKFIPRLPTDIEET